MTQHIQALREIDERLYALLPPFGTEYSSAERAVVTAWLLLRQARQTAQEEGEHSAPPRRHLFYAGRLPAGGFQ